MVIPQPATEPTQPFFVPRASLDDPARSNRLALAPGSDPTAFNPAAQCLGWHPQVSGYRGSNFVFGFEDST